MTDKDKKYIEEINRVADAECETLGSIGTGRYADMPMKAYVKQCMSALERALLLHPYADLKFSDGVMAGARLNDESVRYDEESDTVYIG